ncbi:MAG TPA: hypothetical protein VGR73_17275 [Bryobacteraceae bacterium]|nr:hypothetical protein [Bryobacteraceae bacterium]
MLEVGKDLQVDVALQPGEQTQTIVVTGEAPIVETTNATLGGTLSNETINELPMMGRSYQNLLVLRPGMMIYPGGGGWTMSTNGSRPEENSFVLEGLTNDNPLQGLTIINGPGVAGDAATVMPVDAIQELNIQENPPADYGGKNGAFVNIGVKSGTNGFHGTGYAFGRDSAMDARNYSDPPPARSGDLRHSPRNNFPASGFANLDLSVTKAWKWQEKLTAQFRAEFFNILNHPNFTNPYGSSNGFGPGGYSDPSSGGLMGCGCATPDQAAGNPVLGSGGNRAVQLGLKLIF